jgi:integrase
VELLQTLYSSAFPPTVGLLAILRHTAATLALTEGVPVHIVAARLGDDPNTVLSTYAHLLPQSDELAADRVAALLGRLASG